MTCRFWRDRTNTAVVLIPAGGRVAPQWLPGALRWGWGVLARSIVVLGILVIAPSTDAADAANLLDAFSKGEASVDMRYRLERVEQDAAVTTTTERFKNATASTLRSRFKYATATLHGIDATLEFENIMTVLGGENYDSTINNKSQYPVVADPSATEVNQAYLTCTAGEQLVRIGRQAVNLDKLRFVGTVGWRQNNQTLDTLVLNTTAVDNLSLLYAFVWNVNRVFSDAHPFGNLATNSHVINARYTGFDDTTVIAHGLVLDLDDVAGLSSRTIGIRMEGDVAAGAGVKLAWEAEYATQEDHADSPRTIIVPIIWGEHWLVP